MQGLLFIAVVHHYSRCRNAQRWILRWFHVRPNALLCVCVRPIQTPYQVLYEYIFGSFVACYTWKYQRDVSNIFPPGSRRRA